METAIHTPDIIEFQIKKGMLTVQSSPKEILLENFNQNSRVYIFKSIYTDFKARTNSRIQNEYQWTINGNKSVWQSNSKLDIVFLLHAVNPTCHPKMSLSPTGVQSKV